MVAEVFGTCDVGDDCVAASRHCTWSRRVWVDSVAVEPLGGTILRRSDNPVMTKRAAVCRVLRNRRVIVYSTCTRQTNRLTD